MSTTRTVRAGRPRRGFALPLAVLVLTLLALLAAAAVEAARSARRSSALAESDLALQSAAESALGELVGAWPTSMGAMAPGDRAALPAVVSASGVITTIRATRVALDVWWVTAEARLDGGRLATESGGGWGRRRINAVLALPPLGSPTPGALVADGSVVVAAPVEIGVDSTVAGCPPAPGDSAALVVGTGDSVAFAPGTPRIPWRRDPTANATSLDRWGTIDLTTLASASDLQLLAGTVTAADGGCATGEWGSGASDGCAARTRVVHASGDLTVTGGSGAGVLLVDGMLRITGAFQYSGLVVARGGIEVEADGSSIVGGVIVGRSASGPAVRLAGAITLRASRCAVWEALVRGAVPRPVAGRWWAELL